MNNAPAESENDSSSLFDALARLVPDELQREYYRVVAHTQTLGPDDEMLRILEAMGILALVTRHTPKDIAEEREQLREMLDRHLRATTDTQQRIVEFGHDIDHRLTHLPKEIEAGLNPKQISKLLGETLRQHFVGSGVQEVVSALDQTASSMRKSQQHLTTVLREISDPHHGIAAQIVIANNRIDSSVELRATRIDAILNQLRTDLLRVWFPLIACAALLIGFSAGRTVQAWRDAPSASQPATPANSSNSLPSPIPPVDARHTDSARGPRENK